jgi:hypothetical protein
MNRPKQRGHTLKKRVLELLRRDDFDVAVEELCRLPLRAVVNPLFSNIQQGDEKVKWAAVKAMGAVVAKLADHDMEAARITVRRLMWNLNDESGGIGWGSPEAMGEILARHRGLAREYAHILISYIREDGNYLENQVLQEGVLWAIGRVAEIYPDLIGNAVPYLLAQMDSRSSIHRGLAARALGLLAGQNAGSHG